MFCNLFHKLNKFNYFHNNLLNIMMYKKLNFNYKNSLISIKSINFLKFHNIFNKPGYIFCRYLYTQNNFDHNFFGIIFLKENNLINKINIYKNFLF